VLVGWWWCINGAVLFRWLLFGKEGVSPVPTVVTAAKFNTAGGLWMLGKHLFDQPVPVVYCVFVLNHRS
jgi:hypothetical protein